MKDSSDQNKPAALSREEFDQFLSVLTHEIRNRLSGISLEAADLAEQAGSEVDGARLQQQVQDCAAFLKKVRESLSPDGAETKRMALPEFIKKVKERSL